MKNKVVSMLVFILVLGSVLTTALVVIDAYTAPLIRRNEIVKQKSSVLLALGIPYEKETIEQVFQENVSEQKKGELLYYVSNDGIIAFLFSGSGLWGPIEGVLSMQQDLKTISDIAIVRQEETPGLGGRITERVFLDSFKGKEFVPNLEIFAEGQVQVNNQIDGISGATMTVNAFIAILNEEYQQFSASMMTGE